jgi:hypothetical protein
MRLSTLVNRPFPTAKKLKSREADGQEKVKKRSSEGQASDVILMVEREGELASMIDVSRKEA